MSGGKTKKEKVDDDDEHRKRQEGHGSSTPDSSLFEAIDDRTESNREKDRDQEQLDGRPEAKERPGRP